MFQSNVPCQIHVEVNTHVHYSYTCTGKAASKKFAFPSYVKDLFPSRMKVKPPIFRWTNYTLV